MATNSGESSSSTEVEKYNHKRSKEQKELFIKLRGENEHLFTGAKNPAWRMILEKMGLQGKVSPLQAKKKWDNLKKKCKDYKFPKSGEGVSGKPTAATWPWFVQMDEVLGQRASITPPVLISSISKDTPGPSAAVADQEEDEEGTKPAARKCPKRCRDTDRELLDLVKEDLTFHREVEERRAQESIERMDRLFSILEKIANK